MHDIHKWLGKGRYDGEKFPVEERAGRLEISGIIKETKGNTLNMRIAQKQKQSKKTDSTDLLVYIIVIEFSYPKVKVIVK